MFHLRQASQTLSLLTATFSLAGAEIARPNTTNAPTPPALQQPHYTEFKVTPNSVRPFSRASGQMLDQLVGTTPPTLDLAPFVNVNARSPISLSQISSNRIVVVDFWATWCGPCISALPKINALQAQWGSRGVTFVGACSPQGGDKIRQFSGSLNYPTAVLKNWQGVSDSLGIESIPHLLVIDHQGKIVVPHARLESLPGILGPLVTNRYLTIQIAMSNAAALRPVTPKTK